MPLGLPPLTPEQFQLVRSWVAQGAPGPVRGVGTSLAVGTGEPATSLDGVLRSLRTRRAAPAARAGSVADWRTDTVRVVTTRPRT